MARAAGSWHSTTSGVKSTNILLIDLVQRLSIVNQRDSSAIDTRRMGMLKIKNLVKKYGDFIAINGISLELNEGITGILGANGAGKSTLLNLITDNIKRTSGEILYNATDILSLGAGYRKKVGYTPQLQGMYEDFTAGQFMRYIGALKGMKHSVCKRETVELLEVVGLKDHASKKLGSFSGGMRQRVLLAAAMLDDPEILILDEPTAGLDPEERIRLRNHIAEIATSRIVLLATHIVSDIESVAERVILMKKELGAKYTRPRRKRGADQNEYERL